MRGQLHRVRTAADTEALQNIETLVGNHWIQQTSRSEMNSGWFSGSWSWGTYKSEIEHPRMPAASIRRLPMGLALAIIGDGDALVIRLAGPRISPFSLSGF